MNETQLKEFYDLVTSKDSTYSSKVDFDSFKQKMQSDDYARRLKEWAGVSDEDFAEPTIQQPPVQQQPVANAYNAADILKKKSIQSVSSSAQSLSAQPTEDDGAAAMNAALSYKPQPLPSEGTRAGVQPIKQQQQVQQQVQKREEKRGLPQFVTEQVEGITPALMSKEEEFVVPQLNYKFGPLGFKFEESGITNQVTVTAPNGQKKNIPIPSNFYEDIGRFDPVNTFLRKAFRYDEYLEEQAIGPASELKTFIKENAANIKDLAKYESMYKGAKAKYETTKQAEDAIKSASDEYNTINAKINSYSKMSAEADKMFEELDRVPKDERDSEYNKRYDEAIAMKQQAIASANAIDADRYYASSVKYKDVEKSVGDYFMMKGEQGTWIGALSNRAMKSTGSIIAGAVDLGIAGSMPPQMSTSYQMTKSRDELRRNITNFFLENAKDKSTTEQWDATRSQSTVKGAILGLGGMVPAMVAGAVAGPVGFAGAFAAEGYNDTMLEAEAAGIPPGERELVAIPVGITMGVISELGLDKIPGARLLAKQVTAKALKTLGADFTATTFRNFVQNEVKSSAARFAITAGKGFAHGFEMGVKMDVGTNLIKDTYNVIKDRKDEDGNYMKAFDTPESIAEYFSHAVEAGISMGIGGAILAAPEAMSAAAKKNNFNGIGDAQLEMFELMTKDDLFNSITTIKVKQDIIDGKITKEQGELQLLSYQELAALMRKLPDGLTNAQKRKALGLLQEKIILDNQIKEKDPSLTKKQRGRITEIDDFLGKISEGAYAEEGGIAPSEVKVNLGDKVMWSPDAAKEMEQWDIAEVKDDSVILTKGEEKQTIPLQELQQHISDTYAIQKPTTNESVLRAEQPQLELPKVGEGNKELEIIKDEEKGPIEEGVKSNMSENQNETKIELPNIIESSQTGLNHANSIGGTSYQIEGGIGIVQGFNLFGEPIYLAYKEGVGRTNTDIESYKGDAFSQEELTKLKELKNDLVNKEKENQANSEDPFDKQGRVASTDNVSKNAKDFIKNITDKLGLNKKIFIITDADFNEGQYKKHGLYGKLSPVRSAKLSSENKLEFGHKRYMPEAEAYYIYYDGKLNESQLFTILSHELGHIIEQDKFKNASEETKNAIKQDWANWYSKLTGKTVSEVINETRDITIQDLFAKNATEYNPSLHKYISSFSEYFADNVSKWTRSSEKPKTLVDKFFNELSESFKKIVDYVFKTGNYSKNIFSWLDEMYESNGKGKASEEKVKQTAKQELSSFMAESLSKRKELRDRGLSESEISKHPEVVSLSEKITDAIKRTKEEESMKLSEPMKSEDLSNLPEYESTMRRVQDFADFSTRNKEYWEDQLKQAQKSGNKEREKESREELKKYTEGNLEKAIEILEKSETYKSASDVQREALVRDMRERFELKEKKAPKPEELFGNVEEVNRVMEEIEFQFEDAEKSKTYLEEKYEKAREAYKKSVEEGKPSAKLKENMERAKAEVEEYRTKNIEAAKEALRKTETYKKASKEQQQKMEKYLEDRFLKRKEVLPTKLFSGATEGKKVTTTEKKMWKDQLNAFIRGVKNQAEATKVMIKEVRDSISELAKKGSITAKQAAQIVDRMSKVKLFNEESVTKFIDYASKVFADAEYGSKVAEAKSVLSSIKRLSKNIEVDGNYKKLAEDFKKIKISEVEDIDLYIENAKKLDEAMKGAFGKELKDSASIKELSEYTEEMLAEQREALEKEMQDKLMELGVDATGLSMKEMKEVLDALKDETKKPNKEEEKIARDTAKKAFDTYSSIIQEMLRTGKDPFTGEDIELTENQRQLVERFMKMDLDLLSGKESIAAANSLLNFITNGSIAKMGKVVEKYEKLSSIKNVADKGIKSKVFRAWWSKGIGRLIMEQIATLPNVFSRAFKNDKIGDYVMKAVGLNDVIRMHIKSIKESNAITDEYVKEFYNKKGKEFRSDESVVERGMLAFMLRSKPGAEAESFADRKKLIEESIEVLSTKGDEAQQKIADVYQKVYDKILKDSKDAAEVRSKSSKDNAEAVDWWVNKWAEKYDGLSDVLESVYNKVLGNDFNYTPDKIKLVDPKQGKNDLNQDYSVFLQNNGLYMEESGVLMEKKIKNELPDNRYVDLSFDLNNTMSMHDALVDMNTAAKVEGLNAAINSPFFAKIFPNRADRNLVIDLTKAYVRDMRQKTISDMSEINASARRLGRISSIGVQMALAGPTQIVKQTIPIMVNTMVNAGAVNMLSNMLSRGGFDFINNSDMPIAVRGKESSSQLQSVNKLVELASTTSGGKAMEYIEKANKLFLKNFLTSPDVYIAKASWLAYYEKYMKDNKLSKGPIDFRTEKLNQEAADYAQKMVDKNQNVSIRELQGNMFKVKNPFARFAVQMLMPFANYRMNQKTRMGNDMATIWSKTTSVSDKKTAARSLVATSAEAIAFRAISGFLSYQLWNMTNSIMGNDVSEEDEEKYIDNMYKGAYTALVTDFVSPIPNADPFVASGANTVLERFQEDILNMEEDEIISLFDGTNRKEKLQALGLFGIPLQRAYQIAETIELANTGEFKDDFGRKRILTEEDQEAMKTFAVISFMSMAGVSFPEMNSIVKGGIKMAKKNAEVESTVDYDEQQRKELNKQEREEAKSEKIQSIDELINEETDEDIITELNQIKADIQEGIDKQERIEEKEKMDELLQGYDSKSDMKRYDPILYEETFGEGSDYYEENKAEIEAEKKLNKYIKKKKDEEFEYIEKSKKKKERESFFEDEKEQEFFKSKKEGGFFD